MTRRNGVLDDTGAFKRWRLGREAVIGDKGETSIFFLESSRTLALCLSGNLDEHASDGSFSSFSLSSRILCTGDLHREGAVTMFASSKSQAMNVDKGGARANGICVQSLSSLKP